jgi:isopentenyldiphosphate isomerase
MAELIDIFDANLAPIGTMERAQAHKEGRWHRTFHLWIMVPNTVPQLLFQLRSPHVENYPSMLDVTAAGHLEAGEEVIQGMREVEEELGCKRRCETVPEKRRNCSTAAAQKCTA